MPNNLDQQKIDYLNNIQKKYNVEYYPNEFLGDQEAAFSFYVSGLEAIQAKKYQMASDMLSAALILDNNYLYNYYLALSRRELNDYENVRRFLQSAIEQFSQKQVLYQPLQSLVPENFTEDFYYLYVESFYALNEPEEATELAERLIDSKIIDNINFDLDCLNYLTALGEKNLATAFSKKVLDRIAKVADKTQQQAYLKRTSELLQRLAPQNTMANQEKTPPSIPPEN